MVDVETKANIKIRRKEQMEKTTMSVQELSAQMGISLPKAYELVKSPEFPTIRIGTRILIPVDAYKEWLLKNSAQK
jgi:excisionase family DNA binding protein